MILFIHRKDLRVADLPAFSYIFGKRERSLHLFVQDPAILDPIRAQEHSGLHVLRMLARLDALYRKNGKTLNIVHGAVDEIVTETVRRHEVREIVIHRDDTPYARLRDGKLLEIAERIGARLTVLSDQPLADPVDFHRFAERETPYKVFTPFFRKWSEYMHLFAQPVSQVTIGQLDTIRLDEALLRKYAPAFAPDVYVDQETAAAPERALAEFMTERLAAYEERRNDYGSDGTSRLSAYINTGAISIRTVYQALLGGNHGEAWRRQLAWRDFYIYQSVFDPLFFRYENHYDLSELNDRHFQAWREGRTGIPVIDAAMRQLNETGWLPNRLRMVTAMFLTKNLLVPFPLGERHFRFKLRDCDNTLNRGGWLWSSSLGFDAAPYFRIMNPVTQSETWDPSGSYIRRWLPELRPLADRDIHRPLPHAIVDLKASRARAIDVYKRILFT